MTLLTEDQIRDSLFENTLARARKVLDEFNLSSATVETLAEEIAEEVVDRWEPDMPDRSEDDR